MLLERLELSGEQETALENMEYDLAEEIIRLDSEIRLKELELDRMLREDDPDLYQVKRTIAEISELQSERRFSPVQGRVELRDVLSEKQYEMLEKMMAARKRSRQSREDRASRPKGIE
jgi:hypothetical protein